MKNCILKGLCVIFILLTLMVMMIPVSFAEQDGHGGSTEVIAHVDPPAETQQPQTESSAEPSDQPVTPVDSHPVQTGETVAWIVLLILLLSAVVLLILWLKRDDRSNKSDC